MRLAVAGKPHRDRELGYWLLPLPTIDPFVVARSGAALERYGPDFRYSHYAGTKTLRYAAGGAAAVGAMVLVAQVPPLRRYALGRIQPGDGPSETRRARSWFTVDVIAEGDPSPLSPPSEQGRAIILTSGTTGTPKGASRSMPKTIDPIASLLSVRYS